MDKVMSRMSVDVTSEFVARVYSVPSSMSCHLMSCQDAMLVTVVPGTWYHRSTRKDTAQ